MESVLGIIIGSVWGYLTYYFMSVKGDPQPFVAPVVWAVFVATAFLAISGTEVIGVSHETIRASAIAGAIGIPIGVAIVIYEGLVEKRDAARARELKEAGGME